MGKDQQNTGISKNTHTSSNYFHHARLLEEMTKNFNEVSMWAERDERKTDQK